MYNLVLISNDSSIEKNKFYVKIESDNLQYIVINPNNDNEQIEDIITKEELEKNLGKIIPKNLTENFTLQNLQQFQD